MATRKRNRLLSVLSGRAVEKRKDIGRFHRVLRLDYFRKSNEPCDRDGTHGSFEKTAICSNALSLCFLLPRLVAFVGAPRGASNGRPCVKLRSSPYKAFRSLTISP